MITAVISFCSNDFRYLRRCVEGASSFSAEILVTVCDHFFDGTPENYALLEEAYRRFPQCKFFLFNYSESSYRPFSPLYPEHPDWRHEWHNTGRNLSYFYATGEYLLFLDCDEIVDGPRFEKWWKQCPRQEAAYRFAGKWHFREARYEAHEQADLCLLVKKSAIKPDDLWDEDERLGLFQRIEGAKSLGVHHKEPLVRHYGGVRPRNEMEKKFAAWGHHWERDWQGLIAEEFSRPFTGKDFVRGYKYREASVIFDPLQEEVPALSPIGYEEHLKHLPAFPHVVMVSKQEAFKRHVEHSLSDCNSH